MIQSGYKNLYDYDIYYMYWVTYIHQDYICVNDSMKFVCEGIFGFLQLMIKLIDVVFVKFIYFFYLAKWNFTHTIAIYLFKSLSCSSKVADFLFSGYFPKKIKGLQFDTSLRGVGASVINSICKNLKKSTILCETFMQ